MLLTLSGELEHQQGGAPVDGAAPRRSVYVAVRRNELDPLLRTFDFPEPFTAVGRRSATNVPAQALALLNDPLITQWAKSWAEGILNNDRLIDDRGRILEMYYAAFSRPPTPDEVIRCEEFLAGARQTELAQQTELGQREAGSAHIANQLEQSDGEGDQDAEAARWTELALALMTLKELIYVR